MPRRHAHHPRASARRRQGLRPHQSLGPLRPPLRRHHRRRPAHRPRARGAVRLSAGPLWILFGVVLGGAVHDFVILASSVRRDGKSLAEIAREEIGPVAGVIAAIAIFFTVIIAIAAMGFAVVNILAEIAVGDVHHRHDDSDRARDGRARCARAAPATAASATPPSSACSRCSSRCGAARGVAASSLGHYLKFTPTHADLRDLRLRLPRVGVAGVAAARAARLPVGVHEARHHRHPRRRHHDREPRAQDGRDHPSSCTATGRSSPASYSRSSSSPSRAAPSRGFHSLIASGTTPKMIERESDTRFIGYGAMLDRGPRRRHLAHRRRVALQGRLLRHQRRAGQVRAPRHDARRSRRDDGAPSARICAAAPPARSRSPSASPRSSAACPA